MKDVIIICNDNDIDGSAETTVQEHYDEPTRSLPYDGGSSAGNRLTHNGKTTTNNASVSSDSSNSRGVSRVSATAGSR